MALIVNYYAATAGLDPCNFVGQSLRVGFPTSAADTGADVLRELAVTHTALNV